MPVVVIRLNPSIPKAFRAVWIVHQVRHHRCFERLPVTSDAELRVVHVHTILIIFCVCVNRAHQYAACVCQAYHELCVVGDGNGFVDVSNYIKVAERTNGAHVFGGVQQGKSIRADSHGLKICLLIILNCR